MAESQSGYDMAEYKNDLDSMIAGVMPDTWLGHARLAIAERDFSEAEADKAIEVSRQLLEKKDDITARVAAKAAMNELDNRDD